MLKDCSLCILIKGANLNHLFHSAFLLDYTPEKIVYKSVNILTDTINADIVLLFKFIISHSNESRNHAGKGYNSNQ